MAAAPIVVAAPSRRAALAPPLSVSTPVLAAGVAAALALPTALLLPRVLRPPSPSPPAPRPVRKTAARAAARVTEPVVLPPTSRNVFIPLVVRPREESAAGSMAVGAPGQPGAAASEPTIEESFGDWAWIGTAAIGDALYAVLQNRKSRVGAYVRPGDTLENGRVEQVSETSLLIRSGEKLVSISLATGEAPGGSGPGPGATGPGVPAPGAPKPGAPTVPGQPPPAAPAAPPPGAAPVVPALPGGIRAVQPLVQPAFCRVGSTSGAYAMLVRVPESAVDLRLVVARGYDFERRRYAQEDARSLVRRWSPLLSVSAVHYDTGSRALISSAYSGGRVLMRNPTYGTVVTWGPGGLRFHDRGDPLPAGAATAFAGVGPRVIRDGRVVAAPDSGGMNRVPRYPTRRVLLGKDAFGNVCLLVTRAAVTIPRVAALGRRHGIRDAVLLDGGRSATLYARPRGFLVRHTQDRPATSLLMVWATRSDLRPTVQVLSRKESKPRAV